MSSDTRRRPGQSGKEVLPSGYSETVQDVFFPVHGGGYRSGVAETMARSTNQRVPLLVSHPITTTGAARIGGALLGAYVAGNIGEAVGQSALEKTMLGRVKPTDFIPEGPREWIKDKLPPIYRSFDKTLAQLGGGKAFGFLGAIGGAIAGPVTAGLIRSYQLRKIRTNYDQAKMVTPSTRRGGLLEGTSLLSGSHELGRAQMYRSLVTGEPMNRRPSTVAGGNMAEGIINVASKIPLAEPLVVPSMAVGGAMSVVNKGRASKIYYELEKKMAPDKLLAYG